MELTEKITQYRWYWNIPDNNGTESGYSFTDWDEATKDWKTNKPKREHRIEIGRPRYEIRFYRVPKNRKGEILVSLTFDDDGKYDGMRGGKYVTKKQMHEWEKEAFEWLVANGYAKLYDGA